MRPHFSRRSASRVGKGERGIWQRCFWEHAIRDESDLQRHVDYIHYNPVESGCGAVAVGLVCLLPPLLSGRYFNTVTETHCGVAFAKFIKCLAGKYPDAERIGLVMDNLSTHREKQLIAYYGEDEGKKLWSRFEVHYTPKHGSWLNQAEIAIGMYARQCLGDGRIGTMQNLIEQTKAWNRRTNRKQIKIQWRFTKSKARKSLDYKLSDYPEKLI